MEPNPLSPSGRRTSQIQKYQHASSVPDLSYPLLAAQNTSDSHTLEVFRPEDDQLCEPSPWYCYFNNLDAWKSIVIGSIPNIIATMCYIVNETINVIAIGHAPTDSHGIGKEDRVAALAAVGLGNMIQNVFCLSTAIGLTCALDTLVPNAFGAGRPDLAASHLMQARLLCVFTWLPVIPIMLYTEDILLMLGQDPLVAKYAGDYCAVSVWGLVPCYWLEACRKFLYNVDRPNSSVVVMVSTSVVHIFWVHLFVNRLGWLNEGVGCANVITWFTGSVLLNGYLIYTADSIGLGENRWMLSGIGLGPGGWPALKEFLKLGVPYLIQTCSEWWFWEVIALIVGLIDSVSLAAHVGLLTLVSLLFMISIGISNTGSAQVGAALAAGDVVMAKTYGCTTVCWNGLLWLLGMFPLMWFCTDSVAGWLTDDAEVQTILVTLIRMYAIFGIGDHCANATAATPKAMGLLWQMAYAFAGVQYAIVLPSFYLVAIVLDYGVIGGWVVANLGTVVTSSIVLKILNSVSFEEMAIAAVTRVEVGVEHLESGYTK